MILIANLRKYAAYLGCWGTIYLFELGLYCNEIGQILFLILHELELAYNQNKSKKEHKNSKQHDS